MGLGPSNGLCAGPDRGRGPHTRVKTCMEGAPQPSNPRFQTHWHFSLAAMGLLRPLRVAIAASAFLCSADAALRGGESGGTEKSSASSSLDPLSACLLTSIEEDMLRNESGEMIGTVPVQSDAYNDGVFVQNSHDLHSCPNSSYNSTCFIHHISRRDRIICELCRYRPSTSQPNNNSIYTNLVPCR